MTRDFPPIFATNRPERGESVAAEVNRLLEGLRERLVIPPNLSIATAYINAHGFELIADELERVPRVRLLLGAPPQQPEERQFVRRPSDEELLERALRDYEAGLREERDLAGFTLKRDAAERRLVAWLHSTTEDGKPRVEVRRFARGFVHGKAFVPDSDLAGVLAGSANLTFAGLQLNRELNLGYETGLHKRLIAEWFDELWDQSDPYDLAALFEERFLLHDPWVVFIRMLVALYGFPPDDDSDYDPVLALTGFQRDGVARIARIVERWHGALVADEVGLGKTFLAGELIAEATKRDRQRALVVSPAALKDAMWIPFLRTWDLYSARVEVLSYDELRLADDDTLRRLDEFALVVVDEAHNLRNAATQRADVVRRLLSGSYPKDVVLMSATPVNNSLLDLHTLITYFIKNDAAFASRGIPSLFNYIRDAQAQDPESLSPAHLFGVLDEIAIRRTRGFVKRHYAGSTVRTPDGRETPIEFPTPRVERVDYDLDPAADHLLDDMIDALRPGDEDTVKWQPGTKPDPNRLSLARYVPSRYAIRDEVEATQVVNAGFLRSGLLKRLESSPRALANTLAKVIAGHEDFLRALEQGRVLKGKALTAWGEAGEDSLVDEVIVALSDDELEGVSDASKYHATELAADVRCDLDLLRRLVDDAEQVANGRDAKAEELISRLNQIAAQAARPSKDASVSEADRRKVIVFSTFADTVEEIHRRISAAIDAAPTSSPLAQYKGRLAEPIRGRKVGIDQGARAKVLANFAPSTAGQLRDDGTPIAEDRFDILVTTDVLSEGVNLQQAGRIINYDLPWNPMRLVQRHGRIDRIGSHHREVFLGCFFPASRLDELLGLEETIQRKIAYAAVSIGVGDVIPGQKAKRIEVVLADSREQIERLREERPELFESGGDSAALTGEEYRRRLQLALADQHVRRRVERLPVGAGTGLRSALARERGWIFAATVGATDEARFAFVPATDSWGVARDATGAVGVDQDPLRCLMDADPGDRETEASLDDAAYWGVFDAWDAARDAIWRSWTELTDPANLQPAVKGVLRRAADFVRDSPSPLSSNDRERLAVTLAQRWPLRIAREVGRALDSGLAPEERVLALAKIVDAEGLVPPPPPMPLPAILPDDIRLAAWMAVIPARSE